MDRSRAELLLNAEDPPDAAERGVSYEFLERLLRKQKLGELTTREVRSMSELRKSDFRLRIVVIVLSFYAALGMISPK